MKDRVLIIDGLNFIYRGCIVFGKKIEGIDYSIVYNFFRNLRAIIEEFEPNKCFIALEGIPNFRKEIFPDYKKNRIVKTGTKQEEDRNNLFRQAEIIYTLTSKLPITLVRAAEYEADDTIYTLAQNLKDEEVIIISSDSDLIQILQILNKQDIKLYNPRIKSFVEAPNYNYLVWKCIAGDKSDNVPGILSSAKAENIALRPEELVKFLSIEENRANFSLNKSIVELQLISMEQLKFVPYQIDFTSLFEEFNKMNLNSLLKDSYRERFIKTFTNTLIA